MDIPLTPAPEGIKNPTPATAKPESKTPPGWWSLRDLIGSRDGVLRAVAASDIPDRWKAVLAAEIGALDATFNHIELDAHFHFEKGRSNLHLTITPSAVL